MFARPRISYLAAIAAFALLPSSALVSDPVTGREPCGELTLPILGPNAEVLGSAVVSNDTDFLYVEVHANTARGWKIRKIHLYVGIEPVPQSGGEFDLSQFPYLYEDDIQIAQRFKIPHAEISGLDECGIMVNVGIRLLAVGQDLKSDFLRVVSGSASSDYEVCCTPPEEEGCTLTADYWRKFNAYAPATSNQVDWPAPEDEDSQLCGRSWLSVLLTPPRGQPWYVLAHQYISARLNLAAGASVPLQVNLALNSAAPLLSSSCAGILREHQDSATELAAILGNYNTGLIGPGHCD